MLVARVGPRGLAGREVEVVDCEGRTEDGTRETESENLKERDTDNNALSSVSGVLHAFHFSGSGAFRPSFAIQKRSLSFSRSIPSRFAYSRISSSVGT